MRFGALGLPELLTVLVVILPLWATVAALRAKGQTTTNRLLFLLLIWLVPIVGPIAALILLNQA